MIANQPELVHRRHSPPLHTAIANVHHLFFAPLSFPFTIPLPWTPGPHNRGTLAHPIDTTSFTPQRAHTAAARKGPVSPTAVTLRRMPTMSVRTERKSQRAQNNPSRVLFPTDTTQKSSLSSANTCTAGIRGLPRRSRRKLARRAIELIQSDVRSLVSASCVLFAGFRHVYVYVLTLGPDVQTWINQVSPCPRPAWGRDRRRRFCTCATGSSFSSTLITVSWSWSWSWSLELKLSVGELSLSC